MRRFPTIAATALAVAGSAVVLGATAAPAFAQGWDRDGDWRQREWRGRDRDRDWDRGPRWGRDGGDCRVVVRRWVDDDGDEHVVRKRVCD